MDQTYTRAPSGDLHRDRFTVLTQRSHYGRHVEVLLCMTDHAGHITATVKPFVVEAMTDEQRNTLLESTMSRGLAMDFLQSALDAAWAEGLRPTNYLDERPAEINRMEAHIADLRRLLFSRPPEPDCPSMREALLGKDKTDVG